MKPPFVRYFLLPLISLAARAQQSDSSHTRQPLAAIARQPDSLKYNGPTSNRYLSILTAVSCGEYGFGEIGVALNDDANTFHPAGTAIFVSDEIKFSNKLVMGPKVGVWVAGGLAFGLNMIYYSDFDRGSLVFRPEIGIGADGLKIVYGYNARLTNTGFGGINRSLVEVTWCFHVKKIAQHPFIPKFWG